MANKKYEPMPDISNVEDIIDKTFKSIDFRGAKEFRYRVFKDCIFKDCNFKGVYFMDCAFKGCIFHNCNFKDTRWRGVNIDHVTFTDSELISSVFHSSYIVSTHFQACSLRKVIFADFNFECVKFVGSVLCDAMFKNGYFMRSRMCPILYRNDPSEGLKILTKPYRNTHFYAVNFIESEFGDIDFSRFFMWHCSYNNVEFDSDCKNIPYISMTCPEEGSFIAYKKVLKEPHIADGELIAVLEIQADAKRSSGAGTRKCRCNKAKVLRFEDLDGNVLNDVTKGYSTYDESFIYHVGEYVKEEKFDENRWETCSRGIHFFINRQEAVKYKFI